MSAWNTALQTVDDPETQPMSHAGAVYETVSVVEIGNSREGERRERRPQARGVKAPRNQSLYYFPGTVCSRFGERLRELRRERNLTQDRMAVNFGIDRSFISDVERGRKSISLPLLEVIALGMNISLSDLLKDL